MPCRARAIVYAHWKMVPSDNDMVRLQHNSGETILMVGWGTVTRSTTQISFTISFGMSDWSCA